MTTTTCPPDVREALSAGLRWLYHTPQPDNALVEHRGARITASPARTLRFLPIANSGNPLVVVEVQVRTSYHRSPAPPPALADAEVLDVVAELEARRAVVTRYDNHRLTATIALAQPAHESLRAAVARYAAGCPYHHSLVCEAPIGARGQGCPWHTAGHRAAVWPETNSGPTAFSLSGQTCYVGALPA
ncbi:hypothetical protein MAHJHV59_28620 [Mycobacterium avium subsp. hominissuis]